MGGHTEHLWLGDQLILPDHSDNDPDDRTAAQNPFTLPNGLVVTYGQISELAGDFFGTIQPICHGKDPREMRQRFRDAFRTLAEGVDNRQRARELLDVLQFEHDTVLKTLDEVGSTTNAYKGVPDQTFRFNRITQRLGTGVPYLELAGVNHDHFGYGARRAYNAGHSVALDAARDGDLKTAYMMNAFADHFLQDLFASGHLRVPREALSMGRLSNMCVLFMHDEDNVSGLQVWTPDESKQWRALGDFKLFEKANQDNLDQLLRALDASVREVHDAYVSSRIAKATVQMELEQFPDYEPWKHAPTPACWSSRNGNTAPMFIVIDGVLNRRKDLSDLQSWDFVPIVGPPLWWRKSWPDLPKGFWYYVCWGWTMWQVAPSGDLKKIIVSWLRAYGVPETILKLVAVDLW